MGPVHVRRQGRVCTVFVDPASGQALPLSGFEDSPVGGFPSTFKAEELAGAFPGRTFVFHEEQRAPQPVAPPLSPQQEAEIARMVGESGRAQATVQVAPITAAPKTPDAVAQLRGYLLQEFERLLRECIEANTPLEAEMVGSFLLNTFPDLEEDLKLAAERAKVPQTKTRARFKL